MDILIEMNIYLYVLQHVSRAETLFSMLKKNSEK